MEIFGANLIVRKKTTVIQRWPESLFETPTPLLSKFLSPDSDPAIFQIWESNSCSDSGFHHRPNRKLPMFLLKKWPHRLLLLSKLKSDSGSGSVFSQIFYTGAGSGSERNTQNPAGVDTGTPDPVPPLCDCGTIADIKLLRFKRKSVTRLQTRGKTFRKHSTLIKPAHEPNKSNLPFFPKYAIFTHFSKNNYSVIPLSHANGWKF